jgi:integrase/recombinase XerD
MIEDYYVKPSTVDRVRASWLAPQIESYLEWLEAHRYSRLIVYRRLPLPFHFGEFAQEKGCKDVASCKAYIKEFVSQWLEQHGAKAKTAVAVRKHAIDAECGVRQMLQLACKEPVTRNRRRRPFPLESEVPGFAEYLQSERGFAASTIRNYRHHLDEFAQYLSRTGISCFSQLSPAVLAAFIAARGSRLGISAVPWGLHRYIDLMMCPVLLRGMKSVACWKRWSEGRFGDGGTTRFCFFW